MASPRYEHRQVATALIVSMVVLFSLAFLSLAIEGAWLTAGLMVIAYIAIYGLFSQLRTEVTSTTFTARFGFGWPKRTIPLKDIESHEPVRNRWWMGLGIRAIPGGMLYAVWGLDAVEIRYRDKKKNRDRMFRIGTDDAEGLDAAITAARSRR